MRTIPVFGYKVLKKYSNELPFLAETAPPSARTNRRFRVSVGPEEDEILDYAQIIGFGRHVRGAHPRQAASEKVFPFCRHQGDHKETKTSFQTSSAQSDDWRLFLFFPLYSYVKLNSGAVGRVVGIRPEQPLRPKLKLFLDSRKRRVLTERIVDLQDNPLLYIVDSVGDLNFAD